MIINYFDKYEIDTEKLEGKLKIINLSYKKINGDMEEFFDNEAFSH